MTAINKTFVVGRLTSDPVFSGTVNKKSATFNIIDNEVTHKVVTNGKTASLCKTYLRTGNLCCIEGHYDNLKNVVVAEKVTFLSKVYRQN